MAGVGVRSYQCFVLGAALLLFGAAIAATLGGIVLMLAWAGWLLVVAWRGKAGAGASAG
ncbi:hypothetical protein [Arthrobacter sp. Y81]|uniref:hypothetical protein n=1 Tax=Arthrobacter sp. Y81 TaxID=2058897 RepID=UPI0015E3C45C|nr:hypothetical protein [Arthrobacter sp. Y81]